ncbi:DoxX family protein [Domibacillus sp. PGB-M46]|uniref:DoxX family protein n=1 Tax=Domibacillus sp. PGB-M46 TaxID=2910255 RepID=UPI001F59D666|nr:DoxX family protein [Domibacillus sp. PGB-M46]MCI2256149.1 DoxX family protein [Domibacillus sp. PGB-M46]
MSILILIDIIQVVLFVFFLMTGTKIMSGKLADEFKRFGFPSFFNFLTGFFEIIGAIGILIGIWIPISALLAGLLLGCTMLVAAFTLIVLVRDPFKKAVPALILCVLSLGIVIYHTIYNIGAL